MHIQPLIAQSIFVPPAMTASTPGYAMAISAGNLPKIPDDPVPGRGGSNGSGGSGGDGNGMDKQTFLISERRSMGKLRGLLTLHVEEINRMDSADDKILWLSHIAGLVRIRAFDYIFKSPSAQAVGLEFVATMAERFMGYLPPSLPLKRIDSNMAVLLSESATGITELEKEILDRRVHTGEIMRLAGAVHLAFARRVIYYGFLLKMMQGQGADEYILNLAILRGMEAARRLHIASDGLMYASAIRFLERVDEDAGGGKLEPGRVLFDQVDELDRRMAHMSKLKRKSEALRLGETKFMAMIEDQMMGLYSFTPAFFGMLSRRAENLDLPSLSQYLYMRSIQDGRMADKLKLST